MQVDIITRGEPPLRPARNFRPPRRTKRIPYPVDARAWAALAASLSVLALLRELPFLHPENLPIAETAANFIGIVAHCITIWLPRSMRGRRARRRGRRASGAPARGRS